MTKFQNGRALLIGVGADLPGTVEDAAGLAAILADPERCAYPADQVMLLTGPEATRDKILAGLDELASHSGEEDTVVVYFSGHGGKRQHSEAGEVYFLVANGWGTDSFAATTIRGGEFAGKLAAIPAQKLLVLLDCCHAGGVGDAKKPDFSFAKAPLPPEALLLLQGGRGRALIASSREDELSFAGKPYSAFTLALLEALSGEGVAKKDGYVRLADLALHAREKVPARTGDRQHPILHFDQADNFVVAYYAAGDAEPKGLPLSIKPEIEPEPGSFRDLRGGAFGAGPYFAGSFTGTYIGRDQTNIITEKYEDRSVQVNAPMTGSVITTGDKNKVRIGDSDGVSLEAFVALLDKISRALPDAPIAAPERTHLEQQLATVAAEANQAEPDGNAILSRLEGVVDFLANTATIAVASPQLLEWGRNLLSWARLLFNS